MFILSSTLRFLSRFMYVIAGFALFASVGLTVSDVLLRTIKAPITGTYELVGTLAAVFISFSLVQTSRVRGHVAADFLTSRLPESAQTALRVLTRILAIGLFAIIAWNLVALGHDHWESGQTSPTLHIPIYPVFYGIAVCCFLECLQLFVEIFEGRG